MQHIPELFVWELLRVKGISEMLKPTQSVFVLISLGGSDFVPLLSAIEIIVTVPPVLTG